LTRLEQLDPGAGTYAGDVVSAILAGAVDAAASDVHFRPAADVMTVLFRIDGVLHSVATIPQSLAPNVLARLKVLADLLTYRTDVPQEGRLKESPGAREMRLSTFPTLYGEKGVLRIFSAARRFERLAELGLPEDLRTALQDLLQQTSGALLITGPAGSGKTTTAYAGLREIARECGMTRSLVTLEDPVESVVPEATQSQVYRGSGLDYATGLRSLLRQDPDVILVGEIRDRETAETVFQACLTGHLVLSTFHAGSAAEAVCRLNDLGIESYLLRAGLNGILCQRLFRALCPCARWSSEPVEQLGFPVERVRVPVGCADCDGVGYRGRMVLAELLNPRASGVGSAILSQSEAEPIARLACQAGMISMEQRAVEAIRAGQLSPAEVRRVLGRPSLSDRGTGERPGGESR